MKDAGFQHAEPKSTGRPSYDQRDMLKLYVYGYFNKIRSSRKLMIECTRNIELFYLLNRLTPDFRTISDFRKDNSKSIKNVFRAFVKLCLKLDLYHKELFTIDGTKIRAVNAKNRSYNHEVLENKLHRIDENISNFLSLIDQEDSSKMKLRMCLSEHPFGTVKWYHGAHYFLCKGKEKVATEMGLSFLVYKLKRAISMVGVNELIAAM